MNINVDLNDVITELLEQNKALTLENIILKKALEQAGASTGPVDSRSGEIDI